MDKVEGRSQFGGWSQCLDEGAFGDSLYWLVEYNAKHRGFIVGKADGTYVGVVCEQICNPYSPEGVIDRHVLPADALGDAIGMFESYCKEHSYQIRYELND